MKYLAILTLVIAILFAAGQAELTSMTESEQAMTDGVKEESKVDKMTEEVNGIKEETLITNTTMTEQDENDRVRDSSLNKHGFSEAIPFYKGD